MSQPAIVLDTTEKVIPLPGNRTLSFEELKEKWCDILSATIADLPNAFLYHPGEMHEVEGPDAIWKVLVHHPQTAQRKNLESVICVFYSNDRAVFRVGDVVVLSKDWISIFRLLEEFIDNQFMIPNPPKK